MSFLPSVGELTASGLLPGVGGLKAMSSLLTNVVELIAVSGRIDSQES